MLQQGQSAIAARAAIGDRGTRRGRHGRAVSAMSAVLPVYQGRPAWIPLPDGGRLALPVHDAEYLRLRSEWRRKLAEAHPDQGGTELRFHRVRRQQAQWLESEAAWYAGHGLTPPVVSSREAAPELTPLLDMARGKRGRGRQVVQAYLTAHPGASTTEIAAAVGLSSSYVSTLRHHRLAQPLQAHCAQRLIAVLADGQPRTLADCRGAMPLHATSTFYSAIRSLRQRGFDIVRIGRASQFTYQLLLPKGTS